MLFDKVYRDDFLCECRGHPGSRCCSGPWNGYWTMYCDRCCEYWDDPVDEYEWPKNRDGTHTHINRKNNK